MTGSFEPFPGCPDLSAGDNWGRDGAGLAMDGGGVGSWRDRAGPDGFLSRSVATAECARASLAGHQGRGLAHLTSVWRCLNARVSLDAGLRSFAALVCWPA